MTFFEAVKSAFSKYAKGSGRSCRSEFWYFGLFTFIGNLIFIYIDGRMAELGLIEFLDRGARGLTSALFFLVTFIPSIAVGVRRLHDIGQSGWWFLILMLWPFLLGLGILENLPDIVSNISIIVMIIGGAIFVICCCNKGDEGDNRFGANPLASYKNGDTTNILTSSITTDNSINDSPQELPSSDTKTVYCVHCGVNLLSTFKKCPSCGGREFVETI